MALFANLFKVPFELFFTLLTIISLLMVEYGAEFWILSSNSNVNIDSISLVPTYFILVFHPSPSILIGLLIIIGSWTKYDFPDSLIVLLVGNVWLDSDRKKSIERSKPYFSPNHSGYIFYNLQFVICFFVP